jgi:hypothetical protein
VKKNLLIITWSILMQLDSAGQTKTGIESYNFISSKEAYVWMPVVHHVGKKGLYTEMRYNYEAPETVSVYIGKNFSKKGMLDYAVTPMLGIVMGNFSGGSLATNIDLNYKKTFISIQTQYTLSKDDVMKNFFFNWTELGYQPLKWFYAGITVQETKTYKTRLISEPGIFAGFMIRKFTIPVYLFNPLQPGKNLIVGINMEW